MSKVFSDREAFSKLDHIYDVLFDIEQNEAPKSEDVCKLGADVNELAYYNILWVADHSNPCVKKTTHRMLKESAYGDQTPLEHLQELSAHGVVTVIDYIESNVKATRERRIKTFMRISK